MTVYFIRFFGCFMLALFLGPILVICAAIYLLCYLAYRVVDVVTSERF